jgi:hypothetical protein
VVINDVIIVCFDKAEFTEQVRLVYIALCYFENQDQVGMEALSHFAQPLGHCVLAANLEVRLRLELAIIVPPRYLRWWMVSRLISCDQYPLLLRRF